VSGVSHDWQWAPMAPSWARWLPCAVADLRIVPSDEWFPRRAWDDAPEPFPWDEAAWCDPGDVDDWIAQAREHHAESDAGLAEQHAREHYAEMLNLRTARISLFTQVCQRSEVAVPHTVRELLECLIGLGLYEAEDRAGEQWLLPRLDLNPLDLLPLTEEEAAAEARGQVADRISLAGIALRELADDQGGPDTGERQVTTTLRELGDVAGMPAAQARIALDELAGSLDLKVSGVDGPVAGPLRVTLPWPEFADQFPFDELPGPEHAI